MIISIDYFSFSSDDHNSNQGTTITMLMIWTKSPVVMRPSCRYTMKLIPMIVTMTLILMMVTTMKTLILMMMTTMMLKTIIMIIDDHLDQTGEGTSCYYRFLTKGQQWIWLQTRSSLS